MRRRARPPPICAFTATARSRRCRPKRISPSPPDRRRRSTVSRWVLISIRTGRPRSSSRLASLEAAGRLRLTGPGIEREARLGIIGLSPGFWAERAALAPLFPRGLDLIVTCGDLLAAIPRTTLVEV
jgi:hypothetical protein